MAVISSVAELTWQLDDLPRVPLADRVLLADPEHFDVLQAINPHMLTAAGQLKRVDRTRARQQWEQLRVAIEALGLRVDTLAPLAGQPDLVFCANQALALPAAMTGSTAQVIPSLMASPTRRGEVAHVTRFLEQLGYERAALEGTAQCFEASGDALAHPTRRLLWAGIGSRSSAEVWDELAQRYELEIITLRLVDASFYHLDTCLVWLDEGTCLYVASAFDADGLALIRSVARRAIALDEAEARAGLAGNAFCPDGQHVLLEAACVRTAATLAAAGYRVRPLETSEFLKSGGSVFCMKLFHGPL
jgi:N-dimethylarginine dimethylaminohydrolase